MTLFGQSLRAISIFSLALLCACASLPDQKSLSKRAEDIALKTSNSSATSIQNANLSLKKAHSESLQFYAPSYLAAAQQAFDDAQKKYHQDPKHNDVAIQSQLCIELVNSGLRNKKVVLDTLPKSLKQRAVLMELSSPKLFPEKFSKVENLQLELIKSIEQRKLDDAKANEASVIKAMVQLEIETLDASYLAKAQLSLNEAIAINAKTLMSKTYQQTVNTLQDSKQFIRQNPKDYLRIEDLAQQADLAAQRLLTLTIQANRLQAAKENSLESIILNQEEQFLRIATALAITDIDHKPFNDQSLIMTKAVEQLTQKQSHKTNKNSPVSQQELDRWKRKVVLLQAEVRRMQRLINTK